MRKLLAIAAAILLSLPARAVDQQAVATARITRAANSFLALLDAEQRKRVLYAFNDDEERARWSNLPTTFVPRGGISIKEMTPAQREAAMGVVAAALSPRGFEKVQQIMEGDEVNKLTDRGPGNGPGNGPGGGPGGGPRNVSGGGSAGPASDAQNGNSFSPRPNGPANGPPNGPSDGSLNGASNGPNGRGGPPFGDGSIFGRDLYYISILGTPSEKNPWMLQFGGHHLALNITIAGDHGVLTPTLTGAQPALYTVGGKTVRPLGAESDKGFALLQSLDERQRKQAILSYRLADLVLGPGQDGKTIVPEGLKGSAMTERQRALLLDLMAEWAGIIHESAAAARMAELQSDLDQTWFAWSGPVTVARGSNITAYYRIQGPHVVIEYAPQTLGGDPALHVHTMYRDPTNDYGIKFTAAQ
jgi:hypothetical protein